MTLCGPEFCQVNVVLETSRCWQRVLAATVSDHEKAYKASVKAGGVLVSVDGDP